MIKSFLNQLIIVTSTIIIAGGLCYFGNLILLSFITIKREDYYLYHQDFFTCVTYAGLLILVIYLGWRIAFTLINYGLPPRFS